MSVNDKAAGPKVGMRVWYNNGGTIQAADITGVNANGTVSLNTWPAGGALSGQTNVAFSPFAGTTSTWGFPDFL
jgi:hypothetical protein